MTLFEPPKVDGACSADDILFSRYTIPVGQSLVKVDGHFVLTPYPWLGEIADLEEGVEWFQGGRIYDVDDATFLALAGDGFVSVLGYGEGPYGEGFYGGTE
jgi:hypothetical protein